MILLKREPGHGSYSYLTPKRYNYPGGDEEDEAYRELTIQVINIRSMRKNMDTFVSVLMEQSAHVVIFTESWTYSYDENLFSIPGYKGLFAFNDSYRSGGVAVFVRVVIPTSKQTVVTKACDVVVSELIVSGIVLSVAAIYRSPSKEVSDIQTFIREDLELITANMRPGADWILTGDININLNDTSVEAQTLGLSSTWISSVSLDSRA